MEKIVNSDSTVKQLLNSITLRTPEDGGDMFYETSVVTRTTGYVVQKDI
jgi:hypothetical protein